MVKRYSPYIAEPDLTTLTIEAKMGELPQGRYVTASDYAALQAKLDAVMLEYCPNEMTPEQRENWAKHQTSQSDRGAE